MDYSKYKLLKNVRLYFNSESFKSIITRHIVLVLILANIAIAIPLAINLNVWVDEAYSLVTTSKDLGLAVDRALYSELQAPLYFVLLNIWRGLNSSIFFARLFSIFCITFSIFILAKLSERFFKDIHPGWIVATIAFNPFIIWAAVEIRRYALVVLLTNLLLLFFYEGYFLQAKRQNRIRCCFIVTAVFALYTQYYMGFLLVGIAVSLLVIRRGKTFFTYIFHMLIVGLFFTPMISIILNQMSLMPTIEGFSLDFWHNFKLITNVENYIIPMKELPLNRLGRWFLRITILISLFIIGRESFYRSVRLFNKKNTIIWTIVIIILCFVFFASVFIRDELLRPRHIAVLFIPLTFLVFSILTAAENRKVLKVWIVLILCVNTLALTNSYKEMAKPGDFRRVSSFITRFEKAEQAILVFPKEAYLPLAFHYSGINTIVPIPRPPSTNRYIPYSSVLKNEKEIIDALSAVPENHQYLWVVRYPVNEWMGIKYNAEIFDEFINKYYCVEISKIFYEETKVLFVKKRQHFSSKALGICSSKKVNNPLGNTISNNTDLTSG